MRNKNGNFIKEEVKEILMTCKRARDDDAFLYSIVLKSFDPSISDLTVSEFFEKFEAMNCPPFETVRRTRQHIQELNPELLGNRKR